MEIRTLLVDNNKIFRDNLRRFLSADPDIKVIAEAESGEEAIAKASDLSPDLVLMDLKMEATDGIEATRIIKKENPETLIFILTIYDEDLYRAQASEAGAAAYILKEEIPEKLIKSIQEFLPREK